VGPTRVSYARRGGMVAPPRHRAGWLAWAQAAALACVALNQARLELEVSELRGLLRDNGGQAGRALLSVEVSGDEVSHTSSGGNTGLSLGSSDSSVDISAASGKDVTISPGGATAAAVTASSNGRLGVGVSSPSATLDVDGDNEVNSPVVPLMLRGGLSVNADSSDINPQLAFTFNGGSSYGHHIRTKHNSGGQSGNEMNFYMWDSSSDNAASLGTQEVLRLEGNNTVQVPGTLRVNGAQCCGLAYNFIAYRSSSITTSSTNQVIVFNAEAEDNGGVHNPSNGRFTAPVDGIYSISWNILSQYNGNSHVVLNIRLYKNGANTKISGHDSTGANTYQEVSGTVAMKLDKDDYLSIVVITSGTVVYGSSDYYHTFWSGTLIAATS